MFRYWIIWFLSQICMLPPFLNRARLISFIWHPAQTVFNIYFVGACGGMPARFSDLRSLRARDGIILAEAAVMVMIPPSPYSLLLSP